MTMKEITALAETLLGLNPSSSDEESALREKELLTAANLVVNELSSEYLPLIRTETQDARGGKIYYSALNEQPIEILAVRRVGEERRAEYRVMPVYLSLQNGTYEVEYRYYPKEKTANDICDYDETRLPKRVIAYGTAAEYCLMQGRYGECALWDKRYKDSLSGYCRPRRLKIRRPYFI